MNYRHAFHAGNFADVFKHTVLIGLLEALKRKLTPFCYLDSHAGAGCYDLRGEEAGKTGEFNQGVLRVLQTPNPPPALKIFLDLLCTMPENQGCAVPTVYPGSPLIAAKRMRGEDRLILCETQAEEAQQLKTLFARDPRVGVHQRDGYAALGALLPPKERRGLALVDPPFEAQEAEFVTMQKALQSAYTRWPTGTYALWYPIKLAATVQPFHRWFVKRDILKVLALELLRSPADSSLRLNGCGLIVVNPPWQFDLEMRALLPVLQKQLSDSAGSHRVEWLTRGA